ncbi:MAG TPA: glycerol-3-phosphate dehydrogenase/oxidase [Terriglobales bacterium]|nr:glycerol-3-phosphate dehydrogenase/oxidase [Terriglobales bacterium]
MNGLGANRAPLDGQHFEVAIVGGGINGVAIARECAMAGRRVLLVDQSDFAAGTTSRATRIIHGGLRYLEHGDIGLVRESLRERERLLCERPHLVHPLEFVLALKTHGIRRSALAIRTALWLYRRAAGNNRRPDPTAVHRLERSLDRGLGLSLFSYEDAQCEFPERLVAEWLTESVAAGATARNYTQAIEIVVREGKASGLRLRDLFKRAESAITADWVVNATGPWADEALERSGLDQERLIGGVRGSHIVLPFFTGAPGDALYTEAPDKRPIFVVPWAGQILVGTTEAPQDGSPDDAEPSIAETAYLLAAVQRLYPQAGITGSDIRYSYAGVRPLPFRPGESMDAVSRRYELHDHLENGIAQLITVIGGKLTTAAALARHCAHLLGIRIREPHAGLVAMGPSAGIENTLLQWSTAVSRIAGISVASAGAIAEWHGRDALCIARLAASSPMMQRSICPHTEHIVAEAVEAVQREYAMTLSDILLRRVPVAFSPCWQEECSRTAASRIGAALGWTERERQSQLESFTEERRRFLHPASPILGKETVRESSLLQRAR